MIHVECPSCSSPYDLDERRLPEKGLKMRCPKCSATFQVYADGRVDASAASPPRRVPAKTQLGVGAVPSPKAPANSGDSEVDLPAPARPKSTMGEVDLPAPARPKSTTGEVDLPAPAHARPAPMGEVDLPAPARTKPEGNVDLPAPARAKPKASEVDLPAPAQPKSTMGDLDLPAPAQPKSTMGDLDLDLPAPAKPKSTMGDLDLPAPAKPKSTMGDLDLPAPKRAKRPVPPPAAPRVPPPPNFDLPVAKKAPTEDIDLPASVRGSSDADLPAPKRRLAPPVPAPDLDLPAPARARRLAPAMPAKPDRDLPKPAGRRLAPTLGELDVPAPASTRSGASEQDLPAPAKRRRKLAPSIPMGLAQAEPGGFDLDLPAPADDSSPAGLDFDLDLPAARGSVDLPQPVNLSEPAPSASSIDELDLPELSVPGLELDLPAVAGGGLDLPAPKSDFGNLDLPAPLNISDLPAPTDGGPAELPGIKGELDLPMPRAGGLDLDLPGVKDASSAPISSSPTPFDDFDLELPSLDGAAPAPGPNDMDLPDLPELPGDGLSLDLDDDADLSLPQPRRRDVTETPDGRAGAGGMAFGELDLDAGAGSEAGLEFDDLPEQQAALDVDSELDLPDSMPPAATPKRRAAKKRAPAEASPAKPKSKMLIFFAAAVVLLAGGGFALKWTPMGVFGVYFFEQFRSESGDPARTAAALGEAAELAGDDSYGGARRALQSLGAARAQMFLNRELLVQSAVYESLFQIRFGEDNQAEVREEAILARLATRGNEAPDILVALAASALRQGDIGTASSSLAAAKNAGATGTLVQLVQGELALAQDQFADAATAFQSAGDARGQWGHARALLLDPEADQAEALGAVNATLEMSPNHAGALVAKAKRSVTAGATIEETAALATRAANPEDRAQRGSPTERASAYALLGRVYEDAGHRALARQAFTAARDLVPFQVDALLGLGRVGLRERRFRDAHTQFAAAEQAAQGLPAESEGALTPASTAKLGVAQALLALESPQEALGATTALRAEYPDNADVALAHGQILRALEQNEEAATAFVAAYTADPTRFEPYLAHANLLAATGEAEEAGVILARARENVEMDADVHRQIGDAQREAGDLQEALSEYNQAISMEPENVDALFGLGVTYRRLGRFRDGDARLTRVAELDAGFPGLSLERGRIFEALGRADRAVASFSAAAEAEPENMDLQLRLGGAQVAAGMLDEAEATLAPVAEDRPDSAEVAFFRGRIAFERGASTQALDHLGRAVMMDASVAMYHLYNAWALLQANQLGRAGSEVELTLGLDETLPEAYMVRGLIRVRSGAVDDAANDFRQSIALSDHLAPAHAGLGEALAQQGRQGEAVQSYARATNLDATEGRWWYRLGELRVDRGDRREALAALQRASALASEVEGTQVAPWVYETYRVLGDALRGGDSAAAIAAYRTYLERAPASALDRDQVQRRLASLE
ncbi:MAG: tetratricopeptide repeat protein [Polyangiales bacterium]